MSNYSKNKLTLSIKLVGTVILVVLTVVTSVYFYQARNNSLAAKKAKAYESLCTLSYSIPTPTPVVCNNLVDVLGVSIDRSSSMNKLESDGRTKLEWAKEAARTMVETMQRNNITTVKFGVNSFGSQGNFSQGATGTKLLSSPNYDSLLHTPLTNNYTNVISAINNVKYITSGTCIQCGLRLSNQQISQSTNKKIAILISDGLANRNWDGSKSNASSNAIKEANIGRSNGVTYYVIGYGSGTSINESTLKSIAGVTSNYQYKPNSTDWSEAFLKIITTACNTP